MRSPAASPGTRVSGRSSSCSTATRPRAEGAGDGQRRASMALGRAPGEPGVDLMLTEPEGAFAEDTMPATVETLFGVFSNILLQMPSGRCPHLPAPGPSLTAPGTSGPSTASGSLLRVCGWAIDGVASRPASTGSSTCPSSARRTGASSERGTLLGVGLRARGSAGPRDLAGMKVGLALGAGSLRGYAHVGVLKRFSDRASRSTTSRARASALRSPRSPSAAGARPDRRGARRAQHPPLPLDDSVPGLISNRGLRGHIQELAGDTRIEDSPFRSPSSPRTSAPSRNWSCAAGSPGRRSWRAFPSPASSLRRESALTSPSTEACSTPCRETSSPRWAPTWSSP